MHRSAPPRPGPRAADQRGVARSASATQPADVKLAPHLRAFIPVRLQAVRGQTDRWMAMPHLEPIELTGQHRSVLVIPVRLTPQSLCSLPVRAKRSRSNTRILCPVVLLCPISFIRRHVERKARVFSTPRGLLPNSSSLPAKKVQAAKVAPGWDLSPHRPVIRASCTSDSRQPVDRTVRTYR